MQLERNLVDEVDDARAREYALLSALLARPPDTALLSCLSALEHDASPIGRAHAALSDAAYRSNADQVEREFYDLFVGIGRGELLPYESYYLTGFLNERPLARLRNDLRELGLEQVTGQSEPEDHAAALCEVMAGLTSGRFAAPPNAGQKLFEAHVAPWVGRFFGDLERAKAAEFYRPVGTLGRVFMEIEMAALALPA